MPALSTSARLSGPEVLTQVDDPHGALGAVHQQRTLGGLLVDPGAEGYLNPFCAAKASVSARPVSVRSSRWLLFSASASTPARANTPATAGALL